MSPLPTPPRGLSRLRRPTTHALVAVLATLALGGCSMWPKALSFEPDPPAVQPGLVPDTAAPTATPPPAAMSAVTPASVNAPPAMAVAPKVEVTSSAVGTPAAVEAAPLRPMPAPAPQPAAALPPPAPAMAAPPRAAAPRTVPAGGLVRGFYINAGLYAVSSNGRNAYKTLEDAGLPVFSDVVQSKQRALTRVRVGPYATRAQADAAARKIQSLKLVAVVFKH